MFDLRRLTPDRMLLLAAIPAGLLLGAALWILFGGSSSAEDRIGGFEARLSAVRLSKPVRTPPDGALAEASARPLFALTTGPGAVTEEAVRLDGLARSSRGAAALLSINGGPAQWLERGGSRDGVTLSQVLDSKVVIDTALGSKDVMLTDRPAPEPSTGAAPAGPPAGYRMPPPPASAP